VNDRHWRVRYGGCLAVVVITASTVSVESEEGRAEPPHRPEPVIAAEHHPKLVIAAATSDEPKELHDHLERSYEGPVAPMGSPIVTGSPTPSFYDLGDLEQRGAWHILSRASLRSPIPAGHDAKVFQARQPQDKLFTTRLLPAKPTPPQQRKKLLYRLRRCQL
jgi:hypothetical protein